MLLDFVATARACSVPVESGIVDTTTGFAACDFTQSIGANLLVVPASEANRRRRAIDYGLGAASDSVQALDRAGKLTPDDLERVGSCRKRHVREHVGSCRL